MSIDQFILENESQIRLFSFIGVFAVMAIWEMLLPRRALKQPKTIRWFNNVSLVVLNTIVLRLLFPLATVGMAVFAHENGWGVLNYYQIPHLVSVVLSVVVLDLVIYLQHVMVHAVPILWRFHRIHHADVDFDVTTGTRFHPVELVLSMLVKFGVIIILGPPLIAVVLFEVILNAAAMFNHSNVRLHPAVDRVLRWIIVTPDMHRVHHSIDDDEANSNFGFNIPWWDRLFGTYKSQPRKGHTEMEIGIHHYDRAKDVVWLSGLLTLPFKGKISDYAINKRRWEDTDE